jgi:hypothetical protein
MKENPFSETQNSILIGSLLGDGHLTNPRYGNSAFVKNQCSAHLSYLQWHLQQFAPFHSSLREGKSVTKGKSYKRHTFYLRSHPHLSALRQEWYASGTKSIPENITLTPLTIAIWYFDDGSNVLKARRASFATYCFSRPDLERLTSILLQTYQIECKINSKNVIVVRSSSYKRLIDLVSPFMLWDCFRHKISYRDSLSHPSCKDNIDQVVFWHNERKSVRWIASELRVSRSSVYNQLLKNRENPLSTPLNNTSGVKGVCYDKSRQKWVAHRTIQGKRTNLGRFGSIIEAQNAIERSLSMAAIQPSNTFHSTSYPKTAPMS